MPTFSLQCGPNADPNIRKVRNADPMPTLRTFLAALQKERKKMDHWSISVGRKKGRLTSLLGELNFVQNRRKRWGGNNRFL